MRIREQRAERAEGPPRRKPTEDAARDVNAARA